MKYVALTIITLLYSFLVIGQSKLIDVSKSMLSSIELPNGSKQDKRILATASAKTLLDMIAEDNQINLEEGVEVFTLIGAIGSGTVDQVKLAAQKAGWILTLLSGQTKYWLLTKNKTTLLMYLESNKRDTQLYLCSVNSIGGEPETPAPSAVSQYTSTNQNNNQTNNSVAVVAPQKERVEQKVIAIPTPAPPSGFTFTTTNFDDGWVSTVQEDWVEVKKGSMQVLLHYPKEGTIFPADPGPMTNAAWDILVAPRYSNLKNYKTTYITTFERPYLGMGYTTEKVTGKNVFIVFYHQGKSGWLEFIAPDKNTFIQYYKFDPETIQWDSDSNLMIPLATMNGYNRFAVAASDLKGKWTNNFSGMQQYVNVYTGADAGMNTNSSTEIFEFAADQSYKWELKIVSGMVGNLKYQSVKSNGTLTLPNNWQINFSDLEEKPKSYNAYFSCIKGARMLWLGNAAGITGYAKSE